MADPVTLDKESNNIHGPEDSAIPEPEQFVETCIQTHGTFLMPILQDIQKQYNYLPEDVLRTISKKLNIPLRDVYGTASFYNAFSFTPKGKYIITVCVGTACHVRGGAKIVDTIFQKLGIGPGETTEDMKFTLETVNCLGCCAIGPIVFADGEYHGEMNTGKILQLIKTLEKKG